MLKYDIGKDVASQSPEKDILRSYCRTAMKRRICKGALSAYLQLDILCYV